MPGKGDVLTPRSSPWNDTIVVAVKSNFAEFSHMESRTGGKYTNYLSLRPGCSFQMKFRSKQANKEVKITQFYIWTVGMQYGKKNTSHNFRTVVLQRQVGDKPVGPVESWSGPHLSVAPEFFNMLVPERKLTKKDYPAEWDDYMFKSHKEPSARLEKMKRLVQWRENAAPPTATPMSDKNAYNEGGEGDEQGGTDDDAQDAEARGHHAGKKRKTHHEPASIHNPRGVKIPYPVNHSAIVPLPRPNVAASVPGSHVAAQAQWGQTYSGDDRYLKQIENQLKEKEEARKNAEDARKNAEADAKKAAEAAAARQDTAVCALIKTLSDQVVNERSEKVNALQNAHQAQQQQNPPKLSCK